MPEKIAPLGEYPHTEKSEKTILPETILLSAHETLQEEKKKTSERTGLDFSVFVLSPGWRKEIDRAISSYGK